MTPTNGNYIITSIFKKEPTDEEHAKVSNFDGFDTSFDKRIRIYHHIDRFRETKR